MRWSRRFLTEFSRGSEDIRNHSKEIAVQLTLVLILPPVTLHILYFYLLMAISRLQNCCYLVVQITAPENLNSYTMSNFRKFGHKF